MTGQEVMVLLYFEIDVGLGEIYNWLGATN